MRKNIQSDHTPQPTQDGVSFCENCDQLTQWVDDECQRCKPDGYGFGIRGLLTKEEARTGRINRHIPELSKFYPNGDWHIKVKTLKP